MSNTRNGRRMAAGGRQSGGFGRRLRSSLFSRRVVCCLLPVAFCLMFTGCRMDMQDQPRYEYYEAGDKKFFSDGASSRTPVEGTVARQPGQYRDREEYFYTGKTAGAALPTGANADIRGNVAGNAPGAASTTATGEPDLFPVNIDKAALARGRDRFQIFCAACHGLTGKGDGLIVRRGFQKPPSFYDDRLQENRTPASHFFDVITNGWGAMPDYAAQIPPEDRWKIIAYVRALQFSRRLKLEELPPEVQNEVRQAAQEQQAAGEHGEGGAPHGGEKH